MTHSGKGPGKYDAICTQARESAQAEGAIVIIINGNMGSGFSVQGPADLVQQLPNILQSMASQIRNEVLDS
jgi:hypothetical protein